MWEERQWQLGKYKWKDGEERRHSQNSMVQGHLLKTRFPYPVCILSEWRTPSSVGPNSSAFYLVCIDSSPDFTSCVSILSNGMWTVCLTACFSRALRLITLCTWSKWACISPRDGNVHHPQLSGSRGEPVECLRKANFGRLPGCWQQRHLWQNILESWNLVKNDFRKSLGGNRKSPLTQVSKSQM